MKQTEIRLLLVTLSLLFLFVLASLGSRLIKRIAPEKPNRRYNTATVWIYDKKENHPKNRFGLNVLPHQGEESFFGGRKLLYSYEFVGTCSRGDIYLFELDMPEGGDLTKVVLFEGNPVTVVETETERITITRNGQQPAAQVQPEGAPSD
jgi:hypothetical protein